MAGDIIPDQMEITQYLYEAYDMCLRQYHITHVINRNSWAITYVAVPSQEVRYLDSEHTQQDAIDRVLTELGV